MYLIADSGSTKCDWMLLKDNKEVEAFSTMGFNPFFHNETVISTAIKDNTELTKYADEVKFIFLYIIKHIISLEILILLIINI